MLDGNAVAGLLRQVFLNEMTTAIVTCHNCGAAEAVGATHVFHGAGVVMRCPHCHNALVTIVKGDTRMWIGFAGVRTIEVTAGGFSRGEDLGARGAASSRGVSDGT
jgi:hypothetical protein